jgi:hypothetical protein
MKWWTWLIIITCMISIGFLVKLKNDIGHGRVFYNKDHVQVKTLNELLPDPCAIYPELQQCNEE